MSAALPGVLPRVLPRALPGALRGVLPGALGALLLLGVQPQHSSAADSGVAGPRQPFELTRSLQALQDQIALGSHAASTAQRALLIHMGEEFHAAPPALWSNPANARAAIVYVLSGGRPQFLRKLIFDDALPQAEAELARGALAYASAQREEAWAILGKVDARTLPPSLGAHVALVQATLTMQTDPQGAAEFLESARLLAPGTLVEDAALRRQLSVASELSDADGFMFLSRQYIRRFPRSVYAQNFVRAFPELWADLGLPGNRESFDKLVATVAELNIETRRDLYLALAHGRLVAGQIEFARFAAAEAANLAESGSTGELRAALYGAAAEIAGGDVAQAFERLRAIDPLSLSEMDAELQAAALAVAGEVLGAPEPTALAQADGDLEASAALARGLDAIASADALLRRTR